MKTFIVQDTIGIGQRMLEAGETVTDAELRGVDVKRLLGLGALVDADTLQAPADVQRQLTEATMVSTGLQTALDEANDKIKSLEESVKSAGDETAVLQSLIAQCTPEERTELESRLAAKSQAAADTLPASDKPKKT